MNLIHKIKNVVFKENSLSINVDDKNFEFDLKTVSERLLSANSVQRETFEISPSGYGIHWPLIDEDLSIDGLLKVKHKIPEKFTKAA